MCGASHGVPGTSADDAVLVMKGKAVSSRMLTCCCSRSVVTHCRWAGLWWEIRETLIVRHSFKTDWTTCKCIVILQGFKP